MTVIEMDVKILNSRWYNGGGYRSTVDICYGQQSNKSFSHLPINDVNLKFHS